MGDKDFMDTYKRIHTYKRIKPPNSIVPSATSKSRMARYLLRINTRPCGEYYVQKQRGRALSSPGFLTMDWWPICATRALEGGLLVCPFSWFYNSLIALKD